MQHIDKWPNGNIRSQFYTQSGQKHGAHTEWYETGDKKAELPYVNGQLHGQATAWYPNGLIAESGSFERGLRTGQWTTWHRNGQRRQVVGHDQGVLHGLSVTWDERGQVVSQAHYERGILSTLEPKTAMAPSHSQVPESTPSNALPSPVAILPAGASTAGPAPIINQISIQIGALAQVAPTMTQTVAPPALEATGAVQSPPADIEAIKKQLEKDRAAEFRNRHQELYGCLLALEHNRRNAGAIPGLVLWTVVPAFMIAIFQFGWIPGTSEGGVFYPLRSWWFYAGVFVTCFILGVMVYSRAERRCYRAQRTSVLNAMVRSGVSLDELMTFLSTDENLRRIGPLLSEDLTARDALQSMTSVACSPDSHQSESGQSPV